MYVPATERNSIRHSTINTTQQYNNYSCDIGINKNVNHRDLRSINKHFSVCNISLLFGFVIFIHIFDYTVS